MATCKLLSRCSTRFMDKILTACAHPKHRLPLKNPQRSLSSISSSNEHIVSSPLRDIEIPDVPLTEFMLSRYKQFGNHTAMIDSVTGRKMTFTEVQDSVIKVASGLTRMGIRKGDSVLIFATNCLEYLVLFLACGAIGAPLCTANPAYAADLVKWQLELSKCRTVVTMPGLVPIVKQAIADSQELDRLVKDIVVLGESDGCLPFKTLLEDDGKAFPENVDFKKDDTVFIPFTSGTTGRPQGVVLSHGNVIAAVILACEFLRLKAEKDTILGVLPAFHVYGTTGSLLSPTVQGSSYVSLPSFDPESFLRAIQDYKITYLQLAPPLALFMARHPIVSKFDVSSVHTVMSGAAPIAVDLCTELEDKFGFKVHQAYGSTEAIPISHDIPPFNPATTGVIVPNSQGKIIDPDTGKSRSTGERGEICVRGPQVMMGYLNNKKANDEKIRDGWLHTGDVGYFQEDGRLIVMDRLSDLIKYNGYHVAPTELESLLFSHPAVQDVAVIGVPDDRAGQVPKAFVVIKPDVSTSPQQIIDFVKDKASDHKQLRGGVQIVEQIPKSPSGKILKRLLKDL